MATTNKSAEELAFQATIDLKKWKKELKTMEKGIENVDEESKEAWVRQKKLIADAEKELSDYNKTLKKTEKQTKKTTQATKASNQAKSTSILKYMALAKAAQFAITKAVELGKVLYDMAKAGAEGEAIMKGLESAVRAAGGSMGEATGYAKELAEDGLVPLEETARTMQNLVKAGFSVREAFDMASAMKDVGAFGNIVGDLGQSMVEASKGILTNSIELIENNGLVLRSSQLVKGQLDLVGNATHRQIYYNEVIRQGNAVQGDANKLTETASGQIQKNEKAWSSWAKAFGNTVNYQLEETYSWLTKIAMWGKRHEEKRLTMAIETDVRSSTLWQNENKGKSEQFRDVAVIEEVLEQSLDVQKEYVKKRNDMMKKGVELQRAEVLAWQSIQQEKLNTVTLGANELAEIRTANLATQKAIDKAEQDAMEADRLAKQAIYDQEVLDLQAKFDETERIAEDSRRKEEMLVREDLSRKTKTFRDFVKLEEHTLKSMMAFALEKIGIRSFEVGMQNVVHGSGEIAYGKAIMPLKPGLGATAIDKGTEEIAHGSKIMALGGAAMVAGAAMAGGGGSDNDETNNYYDIDSDLDDTTDALEEAEKEKVTVYLEDEEMYKVIASGLSDYAKNKDIELIFSGK